VLVCTWLRNGNQDANSHPIQMLSTIPILFCLVLLVAEPSVTFSVGYTEQAQLHSCVISNKFADLNRWGIIALLQGFGTKETKWADLSIKHYF
jgi:hypothetical protein